MSEKQEYIPLQGVNTLLGALVFAYQNNVITANELRNRLLFKSDIKDGDLLFSERQKLLGKPSDGILER